jgi:phenylpyruvate tautomerase PptA (4-oxalocrotonate tautomerase family)
LTQRNNAARRFVAHGVVAARLAAARICLRFLLRLRVVTPSLRASGLSTKAASAFGSGATAQKALARDIVWHASKLMEAVMPLARIDVSKDAPPERIKIVSEAIYSAMVEIANVPLHDKFQVVTRHAADEIIYPKEGYLGLTYTGDLILIQITWVGGRSIEVKKKFYKRIADEIHERTGVRKEDVWINLVDDAREDWSFGNGEMQYAPK